MKGLLKLFLLQDKSLKNALCATNERMKGSSFTLGPQWTDANRVFYIITKQWRQNWQSQKMSCLPQDTLGKAEMLIS